MASVAVSISGNVNYRRRPRKQLNPHASPFNCILDRYRFPERYNELYKVVDCAEKNSSSEKPIDSGEEQCGLKEIATSETERSSRKRKRSPPAASSEVVVPDNGSGNSRRSKHVKYGNPAETNEERAVFSDGQERNPRRVPVPNKKEELPERLDGQERSHRLKFKIKVSVRNKKVELPDVTARKSTRTTNVPPPPPPPPLPPPPLPERFMMKIRELGFAGDPVLVIQKELFPSDVNQGLRRLSIPAKQVEPRRFLEPQEIEMLNNRDANQSIQSILIDDRLTEREISFKKWFMSKSGQYVLISDWYNVVKENTLQERMRVQVWSFRMNGTLYFVLVKLDQ